MTLSTRPADVLVIDDIPEVRHCLALMLGWEGYSVAAAGDGRQALEYLCAHAPPRLIVLDLAMPVMDGWQFLTERQHYPHLRGVPVVAFSGLVSTDEPDLLALGVAAVLRKPFDRAQLLDVARRCPAPLAMTA